MMLASREANDIVEDAPMAHESAERPKKKPHPKEVHSDLKEVTPERVEAVFPHDLDQTPPSRKDRHPLPEGARSDHVPHAVPRGENELRGGTDRAERRRHRGPG